MQQIDYCIVGGGYAGVFFAHQCIRSGKSFVLFDEGRLSASKISAGMVNPVVLKKFTTFWLANEQIKMLEETMREMEAYLGENFFVQEPIHRIFHDDKEAELWQRKREKEELLPFLEQGRVHLPVVHNEYGCGRVLKGGYIRVSSFFQAFYEYLQTHRYWFQERFDYSLLEAKEKRYKNFQFQHIVFCEGVGVRENPFFHELPIRPNKGHQIEVAFEEEFSLDSVVKKKHFLIPLSEQGKYYYGGTYDREDKSEDLNPASIQSLQEGLAQITSVPYRIVEKNVAFRPTVADRRPIIGEHSSLDNFFVFNGLGARGVLSGAYFSRQLFESIEKQCPMNKEVSLERFFNV